GAGSAGWRAGERRPAGALSDLEVRDVLCGGPAVLCIRLGLVVRLRLRHRLQRRKRGWSTRLAHRGRVRSGRETVADLQRGIADDLVPIDVRPQIVAVVRIDLVVVADALELEPVPGILERLVAVGLGR